MTADPNDSVNYDDCGFDISHNNTALDFPTLAAAPSAGGGRKYCIVKLTEGTTFQDQRAGAFITELLATNIRRIGVYHFAHHDNPLDQMKFFLNTFKQVTGNIANAPGFLFMLDLERPANPPLETDGLAMVHYLQALGINPIIYCGLDCWSQAYPELKTCPHLLAAYNDHPASALPWRIPSADTYGWDMWQYTDGSAGPYAKNIPGGSIPMDLDCFNLKKHPEGIAAWWDAQLAQTQPNIV